MNLYDSMMIFAVGAADSRFQCSGGRLQQEFLEEILGVWECSSFSAYQESSQDIETNCMFWNVGPVSSFHLIPRKPYCFFYLLVNVVMLLEITIEMRLWLHLIAPFNSCCNYRRATLAVLALPTAVPDTVSLLH